MQGALDQLGELGRELKLRARWQTVGEAGTESADVLKRALGTALNTGASALGLRSRGARAVQRTLNEKPLSPVTRAGLAAGAGTVTRPLNKNEEE